MSSVRLQLFEAAIGLLERRRSRTDTNNERSSSDDELIVSLCELDLFKSILRNTNQTEALAHRLLALSNILQLQYFNKHSLIYHAGDPVSTLNFVLRGKCKEFSRKTESDLENEFFWKSQASSSSSSSSTSTTAESSASTIVISSNRLPNNNNNNINNQNNQQTFTSAALAAQTSKNAALFLDAARFYAGGDDTSDLLNVRDCVNAPSEKYFKSGTCLYKKSNEFLAGSHFGVSNLDRKQLSSANQSCIVITTEPTVLASISAVKYLEIFGSLQTQLNFVASVLACAFPTLKTIVVNQLAFLFEMMLLPPNKIIFGPNQVASHIYILQSGEIQLDTKGAIPLSIEAELAGMQQQQQQLLKSPAPTQTISRVSCGNFFGHSDVINGRHTQTAKVNAESACVYRINKDNLIRIPIVAAWLQAASAASATSTEPQTLQPGSQEIMNIFQGNQTYGGGISSQSRNSPSRDLTKVSIQKSTSSSFVFKNPSTMIITKIPNYHMVVRPNQKSLINNLSNNNKNNNNTSYSNRMSVHTSPAGIRVQTESSSQQTQSSSQNLRIKNQNIVIPANFIKANGLSSARTPSEKGSTISQVESPTIPRFEPFSAKKQQLNNEGKLKEQLPQATSQSSQMRSSQVQNFFNQGKRLNFSATGAGSEFTFQKSFADSSSKYPWNSHGNNSNNSIDTLPIIPITAVQAAEPATASSVGQPHEQIQIGSQSSRQSVSDMKHFQISTSSITSEQLNKVPQMMLLQSSLPIHQSQLKSNSTSFTQGSSSSTLQIQLRIPAQQSVQQIVQTEPATQEIEKRQPKINNRMNFTQKQSTIPSSTSLLKRTIPTQIDSSKSQLNPHHPPPPIDQLLRYKQRAKEYFTRSSAEIEFNSNSFVNVVFSPKKFIKPLGAHDMEAVAQANQVLRNTRNEYMKSAEVQRTEIDESEAQQHQSNKITSESNSFKFKSDTRNNSHNSHATPSSGERIVVNSYNSTILIPVSPSKRCVTARVAPQSILGNSNAALAKSPLFSVTNRKLVKQGSVSNTDQSNSNEVEKESEKSHAKQSLKVLVMNHGFSGQTSINSPTILSHNQLQVKS